MNDRRSAASGRSCGAIIWLVALVAGIGATIATPSVTEASTFDRAWALSGYVTGGGGNYGTAGVGGRIRWEVLPGSFGLEVFGQQVAVDWPGPQRSDHVGGFAAYVPFSLGSRVRIRPKAGFCGMLSLVDGGATRGRDDDVMTGAHAGIGLEVAVHERVVVFADTDTWAYLGNDTRLDGWTRSGNLGFSTLGTFSAGVQIQL